MIPLEDTAADIIGKAQRGLSISDSQLAEQAGITPEQVRRLRSGAADEEPIRKVAPVLRLDPDSLAKLASGAWTPENVEPLDGLAQFNTTFGDMTVNSYLAWDPQTREAVAFDTGADASGMIAEGHKRDLSFVAILLTHGHPDHVADLSKLSEATGAPIFVSSDERVRHAEPIAEGDVRKVGSLSIKARLTSGHSAGGITYVITGLARPVAIVGDSLFAASMGGGAVSYDDAIRNNLEKILTLSDDTIVCPGHGPLTTVGKEKRENPFFAASFHR